MKEYIYKLFLCLSTLFLSTSVNCKTTHLSRPLFPIKFEHGRNIIPKDIDLKKLEPIIYNDLPYSEKVLKAVVKGEIVGDSKVTSTNKKPKKQIMKFNIIGIHKRDCRYALRTISRYEEYNKHISFIKKSSYKNGRVNFYLASTLLPVKMRLNFRLPRINKIGKYPFIFDNGFLMGLTGIINVTEYKNRCLLYSSVYWEGPDTGYSNLFMELFSGVLSDIALRTLLRISP
jgi:hypothetical protein